MKIYYLLAISLFFSTAVFSFDNPDIGPESSAALTMSATISGQVWLDGDGDDLLTSEAGAAGVVLTLNDADGNVLNTSSTISGGIYEFLEVGAGEYYIEVVSSNFNIGDPLRGTSSCTQNGSPLEIDQDDNGVEVGSSIRSELFTVDETQFDSVIDYIDFCFYFDCTNENPLSHRTCDESALNLICDIPNLEGFCSRMYETNSGGNQPAPLCPGDGAAHNISWIGFIAGSGDYNLIIEPFACSGSTTGNEGIQIGIYTSCDFSETVFCNTNCSLSPVVISSSDLSAGEDYYLFIDGCNSSVCSYTISIEGNYSDPSPFVFDDLCLETADGDLECIDIDTEINKELKFVLKGDSINIDYMWTIETISGGPYNDDSSPMTTVPSLAVTFENAGIYNVCLDFATNGCTDWTNPLCRKVTIGSIEVEDFGVVTICTEDIELFDPILVFENLDPNLDGILGWQAGVHVWSLGENTFRVNGDSSNVYDQTFTLVAFPTSQVSIDTSICPGDTILGITEAGVYQLSFDDVNGCDSIVVLELTILEEGDPQCEANFGKTWTYDQVHFFGFPPPPLDQRIRKIQSVGDTILDGEQYLVLEGSCDCTGDVKYIRDEGLQTYIYHDGNKHLLYDYSLEAGDVLSIATPYLTVSGQDSVKVRIDSVSRINYNGNDYIVQYVNSFFSDDSEYWADWGGRFIEGIGSVDWCLFPQFGACEGGTGGVRCVDFANGNTVKLTADVDCEIVSDIFPMFSKWTYRQWGSADPDPLRTYRIVRQDLINDDTYKILAEVDNNNNPIAATEVRLQTSRDQVFFLDETDTLRLLYDFSSDLEVGDIVTYYLPANANTYDISSNGGIEPIINPYQYVITGISDVDGVNTSIPVYDIQYITKDVGTEPVGNNHTKIVKGVGTMGTMMRRGLTQLLGGIQEKFICYSGSFEYEYRLSPTCDLTSIEDKVNGNFEIYPNPTNDILNIEGDKLWSEIQIFDISGKLQFTSSYTTKLNIQELDAGLYYLRIISEGEKLSSLKFVKL